MIPERLFSNSDESAQWDYCQSEIRRQDRLLDRETAIRLLREAEHGYLSMVDPDGEAYGVPVNFMWDGAASIYLHCAPEGRKLRAIAAHPQVSFCIVGPTQVLPEKFTTNYQSVVIDCVARTGLPDVERRKALTLLIQKYSPDHAEVGETYAAKSFHRTEIIRLDMIRMSGKMKKVPAHTAKTL